MERRLSAIFSADMVGFSRLMEADETGTIERQKTHRRDLIDPAFEKFNGRIVKEIGDGVLVEFPSVVAAVECAVTIQRAILEQEMDVEDDLRIQYRVGINVGDIIVDGDDIYGDGVNIAARLEKLAKPGGICVSGTVVSQVKGKVDIEFEDHGEQALKNMKEPCRIWQWASGSSTASDGGRDNGSASQAVPAPTIAVLPFDSLSPDTEMENFTDGLTDEIIAAFSRQTGMTVLARSSTKVFKGKAVDVIQIGKQLGAHYVLEGSVRTAGGRVRVMAQLTDTANGNHLWGEQYDGDLSDMFSLQDDVTLGITAAARSQIHVKDAKRARDLPRDELSDGELLALASQRMQALSAEDFREAADLTERVIDRSGDNAMALAMSASCVLLLNELDYREVREKEAAIANERIARSIQLNEESDYAHFVRGRLLLHFGKQIELAVAEAERALELNPNYTYAHALLGFAIICQGDPDRGIPLIEKALRADSRRAGNYNFIEYLSLGHFSAERYDLALDWRLRAAQRSGYRPWTRFFLSSCHAHLQQIDDARTQLREAMEIVPEATIGKLRALPFADTAVDQRFQSGLHQAGMPE